MKTKAIISFLLRGFTCLAWLAAGLVLPAHAQGTASQTLTWTGPTGPALALGTPHSLGVTASSGLPVTLTVESGPASLTDGVLTVTGPGLVRVTAEQPGDPTYAAVRESRDFNGRQAVVSLVGRFDFAGSANGVEVVGDLAYVAGAGLDILNVSDPAQPVRVGRLNATTWGAQDVRVVGDLAYLTSYASTASGSISSLRIIDVSNPASPAARGVANLGGDSDFGRGLTVQGDYAYIAANEGGLQVFDIRNPAQPVRVGRFRSLGWAMATALTGHTAYLADRHAGLQVLDVSDPAQPVRLGGYRPDRGVSGIELAGNFAYLAGPLALEVLDISQPAHPVRVGAARLTDPVSIDGSARTLARAGSLAFVNTFTGFEVVDVAEPTRPVSLGHQAVKWPRGIFARDQFVYVTSQEGNLQIFETRLADPQVLTWTGATDPILELHTPHPLQVTASSGLPVSFRVASGPATITDGRLTITGHGTVVVTAEQAGDATFAPARETRTYNVRQLVLTELGGMASRNSTADVKVVGELAYVADTTAGLQIINVADPRNPARVGNHATGGRANGVDVAENRAYLAIGTPGLQIIDVSDPAQPVRLGTFNTGGTALKVQVVGSRAYVAAQTARLQIIDVSNPAQPARLRSVTHAGPAMDVQVVGDLAYVAAETSGLHIFDVSDPANPTRLGGLAAGPDIGQVLAVRVVGNLAYLGAGSSGLHVVDVSNPAAPVRVGRLDLFVPGQFTSPFANALDVVDGFAYVSTGRSGLQVIDVNNPAEPVRLSIIETRDITPGVQSSGVRWSGGRIYMADASAGLRIIEARAGYPQPLAWAGASDPILPVHQEEPLQATTASGLPVTLRVETGPATLTNGRLTITGPGLVAVTAEQAGDASYLPVRETRLFNVGETRWDCLSLTEVTGEALDVQVVGARAYVIEAGVWENEQLTGGGLRVFDVSDPRRPVSLGRLTVAGQPRQVAVAGDIACVAAGSAGLQVIDVSDPAAMTRRGGLSLGGTTRSVQVVGNLAYVAGTDSGLHIIDLSNPAQPVRRGGVNTIRGATDVAVVGDFAYVTEASFVVGQVKSSLHVIDVSVPASPRRVGEVSLPGFAQAVQVVDQLAHVTSWASGNSPASGGLTLIDVSEPSRPVLRGRALPNTSASSAEVVGNLVFVADRGSSGLQVLDVSLPGQPVPLGAFSGASDARRVRVVGRVAYVAAGSSGFQIIQWDIGLPQSLRWSGIEGVLPTLGTPYPLAATASSGLPVTLRVASGPASLTDGWLTAQEPGLIQVVAEQPGDAVYLPVRASRSFSLQQGRFDRVGEVHTGGGSRAVQVVGHLAYVLGEGIWNYNDPSGSRLEGGGLRIVDISNPARPAVAGELLMPGRMEDLQVVGNRAYVVDFGTDSPQGIVGGGLRIVDVTHPASPVLLGRTLVDGADSVSVAGEFAYVTGWPEMRVINVSNPASPVTVAVWPRRGQRVRVVANRAYLIAQQQLEVLDVTDPTQPVRLGVQLLAGYGSDVQVAGHIAYVTSDSGSGEARRSWLEVFDVSDPARPLRLHSALLPGADRIRLSGQLAYVAGVANDGGVVHVLDLSQPDQPVLLGGFRTAGYAYDVDVAPGVACAAAGEGLEIFLLNFRAPQPLRLELPGRLPFPGTPLAAPASNPNGLPLAFTVVSGPARMEQQQFIVTGLGPVTLRAEQAGDDRHLPTQLEWTLVVHPPTPRLRVNGAQLELAWPVGLPALVLQHREAFSPATPWRDVPAPTVEAGGQVRALLETLAPTGYFQLAHP